MYFKNDGYPARKACNNKSGTLPECAPLAASFVPKQGNDPQRYKPCDALAKGTLFPGLDLPFKNLANDSYPYAGTPLGELMELGFMMQELQLFLDTHPDDSEVFTALKNAAALYEQGKQTYAELFGPITLPDVRYSDSYDWYDDPWPWEYDRKERK